MRTKVTVADLVRCGACDSSFADLLQFLEQQEIPSDGEMDFDEIIDLFNANRLRAFSIWLQAHRADLLEYTQVSEVKFVAANSEFATLEEAQTKMAQLEAERRSYHTQLSSVGFTETLNEDLVWRAIDIDTFVIPEGCQSYHFHVFNHKTGLHIEAYSLEEAASIRNQLISDFTAQDVGTRRITKRTYFAEHPATFKDSEL